MIQCSYESARIDAYLDIPLVIRPFGASQAYGSVVSTHIIFPNPSLILCKKNKKNNLCEDVLACYFLKIKEYLISFM